MSPIELLIDVNPILFQIGPLALTWGGLAIGLGLALALVWSARRLAAQGLPPGLIDDVAVVAIPLGLVGARAVHVADNWSYYAVHPLAIFTIGGGVAIDGALLLGGFATLLLLRHRGLPIARFFDALAPGFLLGLTIGAVGSFLTGDLLGRPAEVFFAVKYVAPAASDPRGLFVFPVAAYAVVWYAIGLGVVRILPERDLPAGVLAWLVLAWHGLGQLGLGFFRIEPADLFGLAQGQVLGLVILVVSAGALIRGLARHRGCSLLGRVVQSTR